MKPNMQTTIQTLLALSKSDREIARATGIDRKTIRGYARKGMPSDSPGVTTGSPEQIPPPRPPAHTSACEPWREFIEAQLELSRNATAIYQDLVDSHGFAHGYNSVKRFAAQLRVCEPEQFDRLEFAPGEEAQVDYGEGALTWDAVARRWKRPRLFVMTLRYSGAASAGWYGSPARRSGRNWTSRRFVTSAGQLSYLSADPTIDSHLALGPPRKNQKSIVIALVIAGLVSIGAGLFWMGMQRGKTGPSQQSSAEDASSQFAGAGPQGVPQSIAEGEEATRGVTSARGSRPSPHGGSARPCCDRRHADNGVSGGHAVQNSRHGRGD